MRLLAILPAAALSLSTILAAPQVITTIAGGGPHEVPALSVQLVINDLAVDAAGNIWFPSSREQRVFMIDSAGILHVAAGTGIPASLGDGGNVARASFLLPTGLAIDAAGDILIYESAEYDLTTDPPWRVYLGNPRVRRIDAATHVIATIAGGVGAGFTSGPTPALDAPLWLPSDMVFAPSGDLFLGEFLLTPYYLDAVAFVHRLEAATHLVTHVAGDAYGGYLLDDGVPATDASFSLPTRLETDAAGNLLISDSATYRIRRVDRTTGIIGTVAGTGMPGHGGDGGPAIDAQIEPVGMARNSAGDLFVGDTNRLRKIDAASGTIQTVAGTGTYGFSGDGGPATQATIVTPSRVALDGAGNQYIAGGGVLRRIDAATGLINTIAGDPNADYTGNGGPATQARLTHPVDLALTAAGDLLIADATVNAIRRVDGVTGQISTLISQGSGGVQDGTLESLAGIAVAPNGDVYYATYATPIEIADFYGANQVHRFDPATGTSVRVAGNYPYALLGDGGPALDAWLNRPRAIALDAAGDLYIADTGNDRIRRVNMTTGIITTFAGGGTPAAGVGDGGPATAALLESPVGIAFGPSGDLFIADTGNNRVRRVSVDTGIITTIAGDGTGGSGGDGGPAAAAAVTAQDVALDAAGNLYVSGDGRVRRVEAATGIITTVAGDGTYDFHGEGGPPAIAALGDPRGLAVDAAGSLYIASYAAGRVMLVPPPPELTVVASPSSLWPPSHEMVDVALTVVPSGGFVPDQITLVAVTSSEPDDAPGGSDGKTTGDIEAETGSDDLTVRLRAERDAHGTGRVYAVTYHAVDTAGTEASGTGYVTVPHDRSGRTDPLAITLSDTTAGSVVAWDPVEGAVSYDVARGLLGGVTRSGDRTDLGALACVESGTASASTSGFEDSAVPAPGAAFFYVVAYEDAWGRSTYGTAEADLPRVSTMDGCAGH